ncbi:hypothetical protein MKX08_004921 [Trichoderma sp. CBMAI-0020]|nr:hypothetical protein MKX08_004921 [Trichoderma sp. CBMAI-0020]
MDMLPVKGKLTNYRSIETHVGVQFGPEVDLGWTSSTTVTLHFGPLLVGEVKLDDTYIKPYKSNVAMVTLGNVEICNMHGFRSFIGRVIPRSRGKYQQQNGGPAVTLEMDERGHQLSMSIQLCAMGFAKAIEPRVRRIDDNIEINFFIENTTKVGLLFGEAHFILEQDSYTLAKLESAFNISWLEERKEVDVIGSTSSDTTLRGKAVLKGVDVDNEVRDSWYIHAIQLFEMDVDLDAIIYGERNSPRD